MKNQGRFDRLFAVSFIFASFSLVGCSGSEQTQPAPLQNPEEISSEPVIAENPNEENPLSPANPSHPAAPEGPSSIPAVTTTPVSTGSKPPVSTIPDQPAPTPIANTSPIPVATATPPPIDIVGGIGTTMLAKALGIKDSVDLRANDGPIMNQFGGTCSTFATAAAMNNLLKAKGVNKLVSERHLWSTYAKFDADYAVEAANENFITEEKYWPVSGSRNPNYKDYASLRVSQFTGHEYKMEPALQGLNQGHPVVMAVQVPSDLGNCKASVSATSGYTKGQHVMAAVGYKLDDTVAGGGYFILKNSWGSTCGDHGYHYYPFQLCKRKDLYCYFIEVAAVEAR